MTYELSDHADRKTIKRLIAEPPTGCSWSSLSGKVVPTTQSLNGRKGKVLNKEEASK